MKRHLMKTPYSILFLALSILWSCQSPTAVTYKDYQSVYLPLEYVGGYGSFDPHFSRVYSGKTPPQSPWIPTEVPVKGLPEGWEDAAPKQLLFDAKQFAYQNYLEGNIDSVRYASLTKSWKIDLEKRPLSPKSIRCFTHVVARVLSDSTVEYILDINNNRDFSDDAIHIAQPYDMNANPDSLVANAHLTEVELFVNGEVIQRKVPIIIQKGFTRGRLFIYYGYADHYEAHLRDQLIQLHTFVSVDLSDGELLSGNPQKNRTSKQTLINEFLLIKDEIFLYKGANTFTQTVELQKMPKDTTLYSTQIGFSAIPFEGISFRNQDSIRLDEYLGKFLYLDFWGTWCKPCVNEIPKMKELYEELDLKKIAFLGIVQDKEESLTTFLERESIPWPQLYSDDQQNFVDLYEITAYPTTFLINPEGIIVEKDLTASELREKLNAYLD